MIYDLGAVAVFLLAEFDVPVGHVNEMLPDLVRNSIEIEVQVWTPHGLFRFSDEGHPRLLGRAVGFSGVALLAATDDILPGGLSAEMARDDMVEVELPSINGFPTILAGVLVSLVDVLAGELDVFVRRLVVEYQKDDGRDGYPVIDAVNEAERTVGGEGEIPPILVTEALERAVFLKDGVGVPLVKHTDSPPCCADVHGLPQPVEDEDVFVERT